MKEIIEIDGGGDMMMRMVIVILIVHGDVEVFKSYNRYELLRQ